MGTEHSTSKQKKCTCNTFEHRTGASCADCETGYQEQGGKCVLPTGCVENSCGCGSDVGPCVANGVCNPSTDVNHPEAITCACNAKYSGDHCNQCAAGYSDYPTCSKDTCSPPCDHGTCRSDGTCKCDTNWGGPQCDQCTGSNCGEKSKVLVILVIAGLGAVVAIAFGVWYFRFRTAAPFSPYAGLTEEIALEETGTGKDVPLESDSAGSGSGTGVSTDISD